MAKLRRRTLWWWALGLAILPLAVYGSFPVIASALLTEGLTQQGLQNVTVQLDYPTTQNLRINLLAFEKELSGERFQVTLHDITLEYQASELFKGQLERIEVGGGTLVIESIQSTATPVTQNSNIPASGDAPPLTIDQLLAPFPMPPFKQLVVGEISIHHSDTHDPLQHILMNGTIDTSSGILRSNFDIQGPHIPHYTMTLSGTSIGDGTFTILAPTTSQPTLIHFSSQATRLAKNMQLEGDFNIDIPNIVKLAKLFVPIDHELSQITGSLSANWRGHIPHSASVDTIVKDKVGLIDGTFQLRADVPQISPYAKDLTAEANGTFSAVHDELSWTLSKGSQISSTLHLEDPRIPKSVSSIVPMSQHHLSINIAKPLSGRIQLIDPSPSITIDGLIQGDYRISNFPVTVQFSLEDLSGHSLENLTTKGHFLFSGKLDKQLESQFPVKEITWKLAGDISLQQEKLSVAIAPTSFVQTALPPINELTIPNIDIHFLKKFISTITIHEQTWETSPLVLGIHAPQVTWNNQTVTTERVNLTIHESAGSLSSWKADGNVVVLGIDTTMSGITPPTTNVKLIFSANPEFLTLNLLTQTSDSQVSIYGKLHQHLLTGKGKAQFKLAPITFSPSAFRLQDSIKPWPYPLEITTGTVSASGNVAWTLQTAENEAPVTIQHGETTISAKNLAGLYDTVLFEDFSTDMTFIGNDNWSMPNPGSLTLGRVQSGVEVTNISMDIHLEPLPNILIPRVKVSQFSSQMFGGKISSDLIVYDDSLPENQLSLNIKGIDIGEILKLEQQEGLEGTGLLDGTIPMILTKDGIEVPKATIAARPPGGVINYQTSEATAQGLADTSSNLNLVLQALNNFQYDVLRVQANYQKNGTLLLETRLEGKNPDLGVSTPLSYNGFPIDLKGKPIHFNLNIEENIPALMKSLRIAEGIGGQLEDLIQQSGIQ